MVLAPTSLLLLVTLVSAAEASSNLRTLQLQQQNNKESKEKENSTTSHHNKYAILFQRQVVGLVEEEEEEEQQQQQQKLANGDDNHHASDHDDDRRRLLNGGGHMFIVFSRTRDGTEWCIDAVEGTALDQEGRYPALGIRPCAFLASPSEQLFRPAFYCGIESRFSGRYHSSGGDYYCFVVDNNNEFSIRWKQNSIRSLFRRR